MIVKEKHITMKTTMKLLLLLLVLAGCGNIDKQNNGCWLSLKELPGYGPNANEPEFVLGAHSDVKNWHFDVTSVVELIENDSVRISGTVIEEESGEGTICVFNLVDTYLDDVYKIHPDRSFYSDMNGNYSFTLERKDGLMFIINSPGVDPVLLTLNCCDDCSKNDKQHSSHVELKH